MRASLQRFLVIGLAATLGATLGACAGYFLARAITLNQAQWRVGHYVDRAAEGLRASIHESRTVLTQMNASSYGFCSAEELNFFRAEVYQSQYLKDAGRIRDGHLACSTSLGRVAARQPVLRPDFAQRDGTFVYRDLPMFRIPGRTVVAVQQGDSFIIYNTYFLNALDSPHMHLTVTEMDTATNTAGQVYGDLPQMDNPVLTRDTVARQGGFIYVTRCSTLDPACATAYISMSDALSAGRSSMAVLTAMGGLAGGLLGFVCTLIYRGKKSLPSQLLHAIRKDALSVLYQPIVDLESGRIVEAEALTRWTDGQGHFISPDIFVKIAEERGFVGEITRLVVRRALCEFARTLRAQPDFRVSVNVAAPDLADPGLLPMLQGALEQAGVCPESLGIEITESYTARQQVAKETILRLRERGHHVAIDDFGTGYSSLAYLHDLSVDTIKIDKAFTSAIGTDAVTVSILPQILSMAAKLGLRVTVEGIETPQQAAYFAGAPLPIRVQGWLYGHPVSAEAFLQLLAENQARLGPVAVTSSTR